MTPVRIRTCAAGAALAVTAGGLIAYGSALGGELPSLALLGGALGAVLALVPGSSAAARATSFVLGLAAAWLGFALRAAVLPDIPMGRALAAVAVVALITAVATASADRLPLWAGLTGAAALTGAYATTYAADPTAFVSESTTAVTAVLLAAAVAFTVTNLVTGLTVPTEAPAPVEEAHAGLDLVLPTPRVAQDAPTVSESNR